MLRFYCIALVLIILTYSFFHTPFESVERSKRSDKALQKAESDFNAFKEKLRSGNFPKACDKLKETSELEKNLQIAKKVWKSNVRFDRYLTKNFEEKMLGASRQVELLSRSVSEETQNLTQSLNLCLKIQSDPNSAVKSVLDQAQDVRAKLETLKKLNLQNEEKYPLLKEKLSETTSNLDSALQFQENLEDSIRIALVQNRLSLTEIQRLQAELKSNEEVFQKTQISLTKVDQTFSKIVWDTDITPRVRLHRSLWHQSRDGQKENKMFVNVTLKEYVQLSNIFQNHLNNYRGGEDQKYQVAYFQNGEFKNLNPGLWDFWMIIINHLDKSLYSDWNDSTNGGIWIDYLELVSPKVRYAVVYPGKFYLEDFREVGFDEYVVAVKNIGMEFQRKLVGDTDEGDDCQFTPAGFSAVLTNKGSWQDDGNGGKYWVFGQEYEPLNNLYSQYDKITLKEIQAWLKNKDRDFYGSNGQYGHYGYITGRSESFLKGSFGSAGGFEPEIQKLFKSFWNQ